MRVPKFSKVSLLIGLAVGLLALWAGTTPVTAETETGYRGAFALFYDSFIDGEYVATTQNECFYMSGISFRTCSGLYLLPGEENCGGGSVPVGVCGSGAGLIRKGNHAGCTGNSWCTTLYTATYDW